MTNKDKILRYLECGLKVEATNDTRCLKHTIYWYSEIDNQYITAVWLSDIDHIDEYTLTPIPLKPNYKPGDLVTILPIAREINSYDRWDEDAKSMVDSGVYEIKAQSCWDYSVYNKDNSDYWNFPSWTLAPAFPDDAHKGKEVTVTIDGKEYKAIIQ